MHRARRAGRPVVPAASARRLRLVPGAAFSCDDGSYLRRLRGSRCSEAVGVSEADGISPSDELDGARLSGRTSCSALEPARLPECFCTGRPTLFGIAVRAGFGFSPRGIASASVTGGGDPPMLGADALLPEAARWSPE
jgi:hypothetical protein